MCARRHQVWAGALSKWVETATACFMLLMAERSALMLLTSWQRRPWLSRAFSRKCKMKPRNFVPAGGAGTPQLQPTAPVSVYRCACESFARSCLRSCYFVLRVVYLCSFVPSCSAAGAVQPKQGWHQQASLIENFYIKSVISAALI